MNVLSIRKVFVGFFILIVLITASGCSSNVAKMAKGLSEAPVVVGDYQNDEFLQVPFTDEYFFKVTPNDSVRIFGEGKSYYKAFKLPENEHQREFVLHSKFLGMIVTAFNIFKPVVTMLDDDLNVTRTLSPTDNNLIQKNLMYSTLRMKVSANPGEYYMVIHTPEPMPGKRFKYVQFIESTMVSTGTGFMMMPSQTMTRRIEEGPIGSLILEFPNVNTEHPGFVKTKKTWRVSQK